MLLKDRVAMLSAWDRLPALMVVRNTSVDSRASSALRALYMVLPSSSILRTTLYALKEASPIPSIITGINIPDPYSMYRPGPESKHFG